MEMAAIPRPNEELLAQMRARSRDRERLAVILPELGFRELNALVTGGRQARLSGSGECEPRDGHAGQSPPLRREGTDMKVSGRIRRYSEALEAAQAADESGDEAALLEAAQRAHEELRARLGLTAGTEDREPES